MQTTGCAVIGLKDLDSLRPELERLATDGLGGAVRVQDESAGRYVDIDVVPDGIGRLLRVAGHDGDRERQLFDCKGQGVGALTGEDLAFIIIAAFRALARKPS